MGTVLHKSPTLSQLPVKPKTFNMPPITDDEVIDAAAAEKTEDTTDAKAAEPEARRGCRRKERRGGKRIRYKYRYESQLQYEKSNPNYGEFLSTMSTSTTNINQKIWTSLDKSGQVWTSLDKSGQVWTSLDTLQLQTSIKKSQ